MHRIIRECRLGVGNIPWEFEVSLIKNRDVEERMWIYSKVRF